MQTQKQSNSIAFKWECCPIMEVPDVQILQYLNEALGEFSAGLAGSCLDSDHGQLWEQHQSRQEGPGPPHGSSGENRFSEILCGNNYITRNPHYTRQSHYAWC